MPEAGRQALSDEFIKDEANVELYVNGLVQCVHCTAVFEAFRIAGRDIGQYLCPRCMRQGLEYWSELDRPQQPVLVALH